MDLQYRVKNSNIIRHTCFMLILAFSFNVIDFLMYSLTNELKSNIEAFFAMVIRSLPSIILLIHTSFFFQTRKTQVLFPLTFIIHLSIALFLFSQLYKEYGTKDDIDILLFVGVVVLAIFSFFRSGFIPKNKIEKTTTTLLIIMIIGYIILKVITIDFESLGTPEDIRIISSMLNSLFYVIALSIIVPAMDISLFSVSNKRIIEEPENENFSNSYSVLDNKLLLVKLQYDSGEITKKEYEKKKEEILSSLK